MSYQEIVNSNFESLEIYAESVPHLFHYDLAYFWILEKKEFERPRTWRVRLEAWKLLVALFFFGKLEIVSEKIEDRFRVYAANFKMTDVQWVKIKGTKKYIGVLSPLVLVRPLPDFEESDWQEWLDVLKKDFISPEWLYGHSEFRFLLNLALQELKQTATEQSFNNRICNIIATEFKDSLKPGPSSVCATKAMDNVRLLQNLFWHPLPDQQCFQNINLLVRTDGQIRLPFIPQCVNCHEYMTMYETDEPLVVGDEDFVRIKCHICGREHEIALENLLIWNTSPQVILWKPIGRLLQFHSLPEYSISESIIYFFWDAAMVGGSRQRRFLQIRFINKRIVEMVMDDIFYKKIIVLGDSKNIEGIPVKREYLGFIKDIEQICAENGDSILFKRIRIMGIPQELSIPYIDKSIQRESDCWLGLYPDPTLMPEEWRWYRFFIEGDNKKRFGLRLKGPEKTTTNIFPWMLDTVHITENGAWCFPSPVELRLGEDADDCGMTFLLKYQPAPRIDSETTFCLAFDFGTTNSVFYAHFPKASSSDASPLRPAELGKYIYWITGRPRQIDSAVTIAGFLPGPAYPCMENDAKYMNDPHIVPSAIWFNEEAALIRWCGQSIKTATENEIENQGWREITGIKWDSDDIKYPKERRHYFREILFLVIPYYLNANVVTSKNIFLRFGMSYPLALPHPQVEEYEKVLTGILRQTGIMAELSFIDESRASIHALGDQNPGEVFLVADLGGGTLDLSMFCIGEKKRGETIIDQCGSLRYGGESLISVFAKKIDKNPGTEWKLRDAINSGSFTNGLFNKIQDDLKRRIENLFSIIAFEVVRIMVAAYRKNHKYRGKVNLLLVGNGWSWVVMNKDAHKGKIVENYIRHYMNMLEAIGDKNLILINNNVIGGLYLSKHYVARGVVKYVQKTGGDVEMANINAFPCGRNLYVDTRDSGTFMVQWSDNVGNDKSNSFKIEKHVIERASMRFDLDDKLPGVKESWETIFKNKFGDGEIPYGDPREILHEMRNSIVDANVICYINKGVLQILVEDVWKKELQKGR